MANRYYGTSGATYYAKPEPLVAAPWAADAIVGVENGTTGSFTFALPSSSTDYVVYEQAGGAPADTDEFVSVLPAVDTVDLTAVTDLLTGVAAEVDKIPRADAALAAGEAVQRSLENDFSGDYIQEKMRKAP